MELSFDRIYKEISNEEGIRLKVYLDTVKIPTVGIGHNILAHSTMPIIGRVVSKVGEVISDDECRTLFKADLTSVFNDLDNHIDWWRTVDVPRQYVLISLCFNLGINGLLGFKNTLAHYKAHEWDSVVSGLQSSKWYKQVGVRGVKLCKIISTGHFPDGKLS